MPQLFTPRANLAIRLALLLGIVLIVAGVWVWYGLARSAYIDKQGITLDQPIPFSHRHHVNDLGIDCRYCHRSVETSSFAGMPASSVCMGCHSQVWSDQPMLAPLRASYANDRPIRWRRVHDLPDYVYFNHSIHVNKGVACVRCHGRIDRMSLTAKAHALDMTWCLDCHRNPGPKLLPRDAVFQMPPSEQASADDPHKLLGALKIRSVGMTDCTTCHR